MHRVRLCAPGNLTGLRAALEVMTDSAYWRAAASSQEAPLQDEPFPGWYTRPPNLLLAYATLGAKAASVLSSVAASLPFFPRCRGVLSRSPALTARRSAGFRRAVSECVDLLALQPQTAQQLVYGYNTQQEEDRPVSLYLMRGVRTAGKPDSVCGGDLGCQMTANWLMETAVTQVGTTGRG